MEMMKWTLESLVGRDELTISESPNDEDIIGALVIDVQKSNIRGQNCLYVHQVKMFFLAKCLGNIRNLLNAMESVKITGPKTALQV